MKTLRIFLLLTFITTLNITAQETDNKLPYYEIPEYPEEFNECTVVARMIDGLGFRYYWATEGLRDVDLVFKPNKEARSTKETMLHVYDLTTVILNSANKVPNTGQKPGEMTYEELRSETLNMLKTAADIFRSSKDLSQFTIVFQRGENSTEYPFWNQINGPIADALWHCGQIVSHRRSSGNPFTSNVSVFTGKVRN